jgi:hypothetical protein
MRFQHGTAPMTQHVYKADMVAHIWAHQSQDHARVAHGNFWFTGRALYSYGDHYVVGFHMPAAYDRDGAPVALLNSENYSPTTSKQQEAARRALPRSVQRCTIDGISSTTIREIERFGAHTIVTALIGEVRKHADKAANPRIRPDTRAALLHHIQTARDWALHFSRCDAARRDLTKQQRANARARLAELKAEPFASGDDKAGAATYARTLNRAEYKTRLRTVEAEALTLGAAALKANTDGEPLVAFALLMRFMQARDRVAEFADKAGHKLPRKVARLVAQIRDILPQVSAAHRAAEIAAARYQWNDSEGLAREAMTTGFETNVYRIADDLRGAARTLADEPGADDRAAFIAGYEAAYAECREQDALTRAARLLDAARTHWVEGRFNYAAGTASAAQSLFRRHGDEAAHVDAIGEAGRIYQDAIAHRADEYARLLTDWRNASPGAAFPDALHRQFGKPSDALLRLSADRRRIETSQGAEVPTRIASVLWQAIEDRRAGLWTDISGTPYARMKLGHFTLDGIDPDGAIRAGCHFIPYAELHDIAERLGLTHPAQVAA